MKKNNDFYLEDDFLIEDSIDNTYIYKKAIVCDCGILLIRELPNANSKQLGFLKKDSIIFVANENEDWYKYDVPTSIEDPTGISGFLMKKYVKIIED